MTYALVELVGVVSRSLPLHTLSDRPTRRPEPTLGGSGDRGLPRELGGLAEGLFRSNSVPFYIFRILFQNRIRLKKVIRLSSNGMFILQFLV